MRRTYLKPALCIVTVAAHGHILDGSPVVTRVQGNAGVDYGGSNSGSARVKESGNIWDEEW